jgi:hypothetical protein
VSSLFELFQSPVAKKSFVIRWRLFGFLSSVLGQASKDDPVMWIVDGRTANATFTFNETEVAGFRVIRYTGEDAYACEPRVFAVADEEGILDNDTVILNRTIKTRLMKVVITETYGDHNRVCLYDWRILGAPELPPAL